MIKPNLKVIFIFFVGIFLFSCSAFPLDNKIVLLNFGRRNGTEEALGVYEFIFYTDGLLQRINFYTNTGKSSNPYDWEKIKLVNTRYLEIVKSDTDIIATYYKDNTDKGIVVNWFRILGDERIIELSLDGQTEIGEIIVNPTTAEYDYYRNKIQWGYYHLNDGIEEFYRFTDKEQGLFYHSFYSYGKEDKEIEINNIAKRFHPKLKSYDDNFQVLYKFDGNIRYTITRTEKDYPADFVDKIDLLTSINTKTISPIASALNSFLVFSPPISYYTYLHPFITKKTNK